MYKFIRYDFIIELLNLQLKLAYLKLVGFQKVPSLAITIRHANYNCHSSFNIWQSLLVMTLACLQPLTPTPIFII
jgi:hypothetical protein